jgi:peptidoglycan hydrolase CwlO-like protein
MNRRKLLSLALAGTLSVSALLTPTLAVEASPSSVSGYDELLSELSEEENNISKRLNTLQDDIKNNEEEAEALVAEMTDTQDFLEQLQSEIEELKVAIQKREEHLNDQARGLQVAGESGNIIHFILDAESLNDIVGRIDVVSTMVSSNKHTIEQQEEDQALVEEKEAETVEKQEEQAKLAGKLEANKAALEEQKAEQESVLARIASEKDVAEADRAELVAQAEAAEARRQSLAEARTVTAQESSNTDANSASDSEASSSASDSSNTVTTTSTTTETAPAPAANSGSVVGIAHGLKGIPYSYGGGTTAGFDCSGFTSYVFAQAGRSLPRTAAAQYSSTSRISRSQAQAGDLVFFSQGGGIDHVGIYLGGGNFIGAQTSTGVAVSTINSGYWANYVAGFGR